mmetsp:Transcript_33668/g.81887  ORF Transcript_33668/g.81887 Transcript_33668/m.81887 type:complete len:136 (-) Transcript_33668:344-751(-)
MFSFRVPKCGSVSSGRIVLCPYLSAHMASARLVHAQELRLQRSSCATSPEAVSSPMSLVPGCLSFGKQISNFLELRSTSLTPGRLLIQRVLTLQQLHLEMITEQCCDLLVRERKRRSEEGLVLHGHKEHLATRAN